MLGLALLAGLSWFIYRRGQRSVTKAKAASGGQPLEGAEKYSDQQEAFGGNSADAYHQQQWQGPAELEEQRRRTELDNGRYYAELDGGAR